MWITQVIQFLWDHAHTRFIQRGKPLNGETPQEELDN